MGTPTSASALATVLSTRTASGDECAWETALGSKSRSHQLQDQSSPAFLFSVRNLKAQPKATWALLSVCSCVPLWSPYSQKSAFPLSPPYLDHSSPFPSNSSQKGLWQLQHLPQPIHHHCLQLCARWACSLQWGLGEKVNS